MDNRDNNKPIRMIIFALDGVICQLERYHYLAWKEIADELDIPFDEQQSRTLLGLSRKDSLDVILKGYQVFLSGAEKQILGEQKNEAFRRHMEGIGPEDCTPGIEAVLRRLKREGYLLAIASSSENASEILRKLGLSLMFDYAADAATCRISKPSPQIYQYLSRLSGVAPSECLVVDASIPGRKAGNGAGMDTVADLAGMDALLRQRKSHCIGV